MAVNLQGLNKHLNSKIENAGLSDKLKEFVINAVRDLIVEWLKTDWLQNWIAGKVSEVAAAVGMPLTLTNITDKEATRADFDAAVTAKINALAGTTFASVATLNREALAVEVGRILGEKLGLGALYPVENFRVAVGNNLVQSLDGSAAVSMFDAGTLQAIETRVLSTMKPLSDKAQAWGNPMAKAGPPVDAAQAAKRADNRRRQAKYRRNNHLKWAPMGGV